MNPLFQGIGNDFRNCLKIFPGNLKNFSYRMTPRTQQQQQQQQQQQLDKITQRFYSRKNVCQNKRYRANTSLLV
jgi:hypothetical protein